MKLIEANHGRAFLANYHLLITLKVLTSRLMRHGHPAEHTMKL